MGNLMSWLSSDKAPSWIGSSTSQLLAVSTLAYIGGAFWFMRHGNVEAGFAALAGIFNSFMALYSHKKGVESTQDQPEVKPTA